MVALTETWMEGKEGEHEKIEKIMEGYRIEFKKARREGARGRARGGIMLAVRGGVGEWVEVWNEKGKKEVMGGT